MRLSKLSSRVPVSHFWLLGFAISMLVLLAFSWTNLQVAYSGKSDELPLSMRVPMKGPGYPPVLAYWIFGTEGDSKRIMKLSKAVYHPRNKYLLQLDAAATDYERLELAFSVEAENTFQAFGNVNVVRNGYAFSQIGASALAATLQAAALLLKISNEWDWFITLSASDYPLMTQDDILHAFKFLPKDLNFIDFESTGWKERKNTKKIVVDPSLYLGENRPLFYAVEPREKPDAFSIFGGSPWTILSRGLMEHCINGLDNLPRKLLMYLTNVEFPMELYFQTVVCNSPELQNTTTNNDLRFNALDKSTTADQRNMSWYEKMVSSEKVFAGPFKEGDRMLEEIDKKVLNHTKDGFVPGKWCLKLGQRINVTLAKYFNSNNCLKWGDINSIQEGPRGVKLGKFFSNLVLGKKFVANLCHNNEV